MQVCDGVKKKRDRYAVLAFFRPCGTFERHEISVPQSW